MTEQLPRYIPTPPPAKPADAPAWIQRELNKIARVLSASTTLIEELDVRTTLGYRWIDLAGPVTAIPLQGSLGDPDRDTDGTLLFDATAVEQIAQIYQLQHGVDLATSANLHLHWRKTTAAAGDVVWQMRYQTWKVGTEPTAWSSWLARTGRSESVASDLREIIDYWSVDISALADSGHIGCQFRRLATDSANTYAADARMISADAHIRMYEHQGSILEWPS